MSFIVSICLLFWRVNVIWVKKKIKREIEGHDVLSSNSKTTKYEHVLPKLAEFEDNKDMDGLFIGAPQTYDYF